MKGSSEKYDAGLGGRELTVEGKGGEELGGVLYVPGTSVRILEKWGQAEEDHSPTSGSGGGCD